MWTHFSKTNIPDVKCTYQDKNVIDLMVHESKIFEQFYLHGMEDIWSRYTNNIIIYTRDVRKNMQISIWRPQISS